MTLWDALTSQLALRARETVVADGDVWSGTRGQLAAAAERVAAALDRVGVRDGQLVGCVLTNTPSVMSGLFGVWWAGAAVASLPVAARGMSLEAYLAQLRSLSGAAALRFVLLEDRLLRALPSDHGIPAELLSYESLTTGAGRLEPRPVGADEVAFVQFSSGTTSRPRGAMLTPAAIDAQLHLLAERLDVHPERDAASIWLPFSHDMGLFGWLMCWRAGVRSHISAPERFISSPWTWLDDCAEFAATISPAPPLALTVAAQASRSSRSAKRLGAMRCLVLGGERIQSTAVGQALDLLADRGLASSAITPAYGLAEATLAVTVAEPGSGWRARPNRGSANGELVVSCGVPLRGFEVRIDSGPGDKVGEICVRAPSLSIGYLGDPELTAARLRGRELRTGDHGFMVDGELHVVGRLDDLLVISGRNVYAQEVEAALVRDRRVRPGACAVIELPSERGRSRYLALAETTPVADDLPALARSLASTAMRHAGLPLDECLFIPRGKFPKTPSGKPQRFRCRELAADRPDGSVRVDLRRAAGARGS